MIRYCQVRINCPCNFLLFFHSGIQKMVKPVLSNIIQVPDLLQKKHREEKIRRYT